MNELFEMLKRGEFPNFLQVMTAVSDGTDRNWDFGSQNDCPYGEDSPSRCPIFSVSGQRCLACQ